jgi:hypothetical protein
VVAEIGDFVSRSSGKRDDKVVYFVDSLPAGISKFRYLARAMHTGKFVAPPTRAELMYEPTIFGSTPATHVRVTQVGKKEAMKRATLDGPFMDGFLRRGRGGDFGFGRLE